MRVNQGKEKKVVNSQVAKDAKIALLKSEYNHGALDIMDFLMKISSFTKDFAKRLIDFD